MFGVKDRQIAGLSLLDYGLGVRNLNVQLIAKGCGVMRDLVRLTYEKDGSWHGLFVVDADCTAIVSRAELK